MIQLRDYQQKAVDSVFKSFKRYPDEHPVIGLPTGAGKSYVIAAIIEKAVTEYENVNILVLSHVKEIIEQDYNAIKNFTGRDVGLYSAGLFSKEIRQVTVAGIQSVYRKAPDFKQFNFIIIDEVHTVPLEGNGMYKTFFDAMGNIRYLGLSATLFRLGGGYIYGKDKLFNRVSYDLTSREAFKKFVDDGYLSNLKTIATNIEYDVQKIHTQNGDFKISDMSDRFDRTPITDGAIQEIIKHGENYKKWLIFAIDIEHAEHIAETLIRNNIMTNVVHSKMDDDRDMVIRNFKRGKYRALVNVNVLTTGFDDPEIDLIALLRPTKSPVLHVQMIGRGLRVSPNKSHCLVLDFGGNTERLGPIDSVEVKVKKKGTGGEPITKTCPSCDTIHHPSVRICEFCQHEFEFKHGLGDSSGRDVLTQGIKWYQVDNVQYFIHTKTNKPDSLLVVYTCGLKRFKEYKFLNHPGYAGRMGRYWVEYRGVPAKTVEEAYVKCDQLMIPNKIRVDTTEKYPDIIDYSF
jgi:DNA repair protein RadD